MEVIQPGIQILYTQPDVYCQPSMIYIHIFFL